VFGIGIGTQGNEDGSILKQTEGAVQFDGSWADGVKTTGKALGKRLVKGKGTAILQDQSTKLG
jgi:hypothetical protein